MANDMLLSLQLSHDLRFFVIIILHYHRTNDETWTKNIEVPN